VLFRLKNICKKTAPKQSRQTVMAEEKKVVSQGKMSCQQISKIIMEQMSKIKVPLLEHILMQFEPLSSI